MCACVKKLYSCRTPDQSSSATQRQGRRRRKDGHARRPGSGHTPVWLHRNVPLVFASTHVQLHYRESLLLSSNWSDLQSLFDLLVLTNSGLGLFKIISCWYNVSNRSGTVALGRRLPAHFWRPSAPTPLIRFSDVVVRRTRNTYGDRCFAAAGPRVWNSLPAELRQCDSHGQFKRRLKTYLYGIWDHGALWLLVRQRRIEIPLLTYLLTRQCCVTRTDRGTLAAFRSNVCCPYRRAALVRAACSRDDSRRAPSLHRDAGKSSRASLDSACSCDLARTHTCPSETRNCTRMTTHFTAQVWDLHTVLQKDAVSRNAYRAKNIVYSLELLPSRKLLFDDRFWRTQNFKQERITNSLYTNQVMCVKWNGGRSRWFHVVNGVKQGGVLSPTLFCVYLDGLLNTLCSSKGPLHTLNQMVNQMVNHLVSCWRVAGNPNPRLKLT